MRMAGWMGVALPLLFACEQQSAPKATPQQPAAEALTDGVVRTSTRLPASVDSCLDQSMKDLGVGAKRAPDARAWAVGPEKIHAALVGKGEVRIAADVTAEAAEVTVEAAWKGPLEGQHRAELERRLRDMTARIGFFCGERNAQVQCQSGPAASPAPCAEG